jgi:hypothetical protein
MEEWRPVPGWGNLYHVSSSGQVVSYHPRWRAPRMLKPKVDRYGYLVVHLRYCEYKSYPTVHRLVALAFLGKPSKRRPHVNHKDGVKLNNHYTNLEYVSNQENMTHAAGLGLFRGERNPACVLDSDAVLRIRAEYRFGTHEFGTRALARKYGVSQSTIWFITSNRHWNHI